MTAPAIRRLNHDIRRLHQAQHERKKDAKELRRGERELKRDRRHGDRVHDAFDENRKELKGDRKSLEKLRDTEAKRLKELGEKRADLQAQVDASIDPLTGQPDPGLQLQLGALDQHLAEVKNGFDRRIADKRTEIDELKGAMSRERQEIQDTRKEIKHDRREVKHDKKALERTKDHVRKALHTARSHLRPAEYKMGLKQTNRARHELGLESVNHVIRPMNLNTVQGCAQFLLHSKNVSFWSGLSTGSDRKNLERLARGEKAFVPATGGHVTPKLSMMQALVDMAKHGHIQINALTGGIHSTGSNHYSGTAVDLDVNVGSASQIAAIANRHGGFRNSETDHIHLDF